MRYSRVGAILDELRLGQAAAASGSGELDSAGLFAEVRTGEHKLDRLRSALAGSLEADKEDYLTSARWIRPVVVLRGSCARLEPFGGSALPSWFPHLERESTVLGQALWRQLKPTILPRGTALVGLAVGWWLANTYTDSHFRSAMHSLGLGGGGKRVVSGDTYQAMRFWLPMLAAAVFAYLVDRGHYLVQRRYSRPTPPS